MAGIRQTPDSNLQSVTINYSSSATGQNPQLQILNSPGGSNGQIQFNAGNGKFGASPNMVWNNANRILNVLGTVRASNIQGKINTNLTNFKLTGGNVGDTLTTDGTGNLIWVEGENYGNSNVANYLPNYSANISAANINVSNTIYTGNISVTGTAFLTTVSVNGVMNTHAITSNGNVTANYFAGNASLLSSLTGANVTGQVGNSLLSGTVYTNSQPNITSLGILTSLQVSGNITSNDANLGNSVTANYFIGNGSLLTGLPEQYSNSNVANYLASYTGNISAANANLGNVVNANYFTGDGGSLSNITYSNINGIGNISTINLDGNASNLLSGDGNFIAIPVIPSLGNISTINLDGNANTILYGNGVFAVIPTIDTGNFTFNNNSINTANSSSNITLNITGAGAKTWIFANTGDFYSAGNMQGGNIVATGNITVNNWINTAGSTNMILNPGTNQIRAIGHTEPYHNDSWRLGCSSARWSAFYANEGNFSGTLSVSGNANALNLGATTIQLTGTGTAVNASQGNILTNQVTGTKINFLSGAYTVSLTTGSTNATYTLSLPANAGTTGQVLTTDGLGVLSWSTPAGSYSNTNVGDYLPTYTGNVSANYFIGNGSTLNNITGANVTGTVGYAAVANSVAAANVSGLGNVAVLNTDGNSSNILYGNGTFAAAPSGSSYGNSNVSTLLASFGSNNIVTTGNITGGFANFSGTATTGVNSILSGPTFTPLPNTMAGFVSNVNSYTQLTIQNKSNGADATTDFIATADNGSDTVNYLDLGIINSGYDANTPTNSLGNIVYAADGYLYSQGNVSNTSQSGGNLAIGTTVAGKSVKIFAGGANANSIVTTFANTGATITGNLTLSGNIIGSTPNVTLTAGSFSATFDNTGKFTLPSMGGDEGAEINLGIPSSNTTLTTRVVFDVFQDRIRFFDGATKGAYIDLSQAAVGVNTLLNNRVSGLVNAGTFVTMDNIKATVTTTGNRGLSLATVSGSFSYMIAGSFSLASTVGGATLASQTLTTTATTSIFGYAFTAAGDLSTYILTDTTNSRAYRITLQIGASYNNNMISIERLV